MIFTPSSVIVGIPVRDEEALLFACLDALRHQQSAQWTIDIILLFDGCEDAGLVLAKRYQQAFPSVRLHIAEQSRSAKPHAGRARQAALDLCYHLCTEPARTIIATTDADSIVAPDWVKRNVAALRTAHVAAGWARLADVENVAPRRAQLESYWNKLHRLRCEIDPISYDPYPSHRYIGGASLAFHAAVYPELRSSLLRVSGEDEAFVHAARLAGYKIRCDPEIAVETSARLIGRATHGLADALVGNSKEATQKREVMVMCPLAAAAKYRRQAEARRAWQEGDQPRIAKFIGAIAPKSAALRAKADMARSADAFVQLTVPDRDPVAKRVEISKAMAILRDIETEMAAAA